MKNRRKIVKKGRSSNLLLPLTPLVRTLKYLALLLLPSLERWKFSKRLWRQLRVPLQQCKQIFNLRK
jgi:hypothetical protein